MARKRWSSGLAKLLIAALLLQGIPLAYGSGYAVYAEESGSGQEIGDSSPSVTSSTYGANDKLTDYTWERGDKGTFKPAARQAATMAFDEAASNVVLFGGENGSASLLNDTWIWDGMEQTWHQEANGSVPKPGARKHAVMAYDHVAKQVLLFGGVGSSGLLGDTWLWDGQAGTWTPITGLATSPSPRAGAQMAYDGANLILFGGYKLTGSTKTPLGDTWLWDGAGWTDVTPADQADSPPAAYDGQMSFDGQSAVLYGGITGNVTVNNGTADVTMKDSSPALWSWHADTKTWSSTPGPETFGRWGHTMAYDGRRVVFFSGERDYLHWVNDKGTLLTDLKMPSSVYPYPRTSLAYGWKDGAWERYPQVGSSGTAFMDDVGYPGQLQLYPNQKPFPISYASMAFDGTNFIVFGGHRDAVDVWDKHQIQGGKKLQTVPAGVMDETWVFGYTPPSAPGIQLVSDPIINLDPDRLNDTVSVVASVYSLGGNPVTSRGVEYRPYTEEGNEAWITVPYPTDPQAKGSFTVTLTGLTWQKEYELRGFATNTIGTSYTESKRFALTNDDSMQPPDVRYDRVGASVLHVKDKKRLVAVGEGVTNLLRRPLNQIHYYLKSGSDIYPLKYNILSDRQLELTWDADLPPGKYDVHLEHEKYQHHVFNEGLMVTTADFYEPRSFARVDVPSTSPGNEINSLALQGPFTEDPIAPKVFALNDPSKVVAINETVLFKGSRLVVDKSNPAKTVVSGTGRLYIDGGGSQGPNVSYTLHNGSFTFSSDSFAMALSDSDSADLLKIDMPVKMGNLTFVKGGLKLDGSLELGFAVGSQKVSKAIPVDNIQYRNGRFELTGNYALDKSFKVGPINVSDTSFVIDSRLPSVNVKGKGSLPGTDVSFDLLMKLKQGRLDEIGFNMFNKSKLASTGLQVNYLTGKLDKLAGKTQIPQSFRVSGSVTDILVPQLKHPTVNSKFNLLGTDEINVNLTPYGFEATGIEYYYWLAVNQMNLQAVVNPSLAAIKGLSSPGFLVSGDINAYDMIKGKIAAVSLNKKGYNGVLKATVYVPKGIPRIGGATVRNVTLSVNEKQMIGMLKHNGIAARVSYTFSTNIVLFEVEAEPPKKSWWEKGLDFVGNALNSVNDFFDKYPPLEDLLDELIDFQPSNYSLFNIAAAGDWMKDFDFNQFNLVASVQPPTDEMKRVYELTPAGMTLQPDDTAEKGARARIADGQFTSVDRTSQLTVQTSAAGGGQIASVFPVNRAFEALIVMTGDQRSASLKVSSVAKPNVETTAKTESAYDADTDTTYMLVSLYEGSWKLIAGGDGRIRVHELLFANPALELRQLAEKWAQTSDRPVTSLLVEKRGLYDLKVETAGEAVLYKPDGRPYHLQNSQGDPGWNAFRDDDGHLHALLNAVEAGTWLISADASPMAWINHVPQQTTIGDLQQWVQNETFPTVFEMSRTSSGQAVVEIYGADADTKLYTPAGELYPLQPNPNLNGMNVSYDEARQKMTVWLGGVELKGQWKAVGSSYTSVVASHLSRKLKSIKPLLNEGRYSKSVVLPEKGDYMLSVSGGDTDTVFMKPDGSSYELIFTGEQGNAYLQPAADRMPSPGGGAQVVTPDPVQDGRDMLYVTLLNAPAGKWLVQSKTRTDVQIQKLIPLPAVKASVSSVAGAENRIRVTWSTDNAVPGTEASIMLTGSKDAYIGEVLADGLPAAGSTEIDIPASTVPGTYYLSVAATSDDEAPAYAVADDTVEVAAPYALAAPSQPEVVSTGNGEISLRFHSVSGQVERYRVWLGTGAGSQPVTPVLDIEPQAAATQQAVISGLPVDADYTLAVSAIGEQAGRLVLSPLSESVGLTLPAPQPAALSVSLDAGADPVVARTFKAYDGSDRTLLIAAAQQASLEVTASQGVSMALTVDGQTFDSVQVSKDGTHSFDLNSLLGTAELEEREYTVQIETVNDRGDRSAEYRKLVVDRTAPMLIASGGDDEEGMPIPLNGTVDASGKLLIVGQTEIGAKLDINGVIVPLDGAGRFVYYAPLAWNDGSDRIEIVMKASDEVGNTTSYGFEVLKDVVGTGPTYPEDLASLTTGDAAMSAPYQFGATSYQAEANGNKVRVYAVPMVSSSLVTIDGKTLDPDGYVEVEMDDVDHQVSISVKPLGSSPAKIYTLLLSPGSSAALLSKLTLKAQSGETLAASPFTGTEETYDVYVDNAVESVTITPDALMKGSQIKVKGQVVQNGEESLATALLVGENQIPVSVVSPDGTNTRSYQVVVWREPSGNAELQQLGIQTSGAALTPAFDPNVWNYRVQVPAATATFALQPVAQQADANILVNGQAVTGGTTTIPFTGDGLTVKIEVVAQDDSARTYTLSVLRQKATPEQPPLLSSLEASTSLDGAFAPYRFNYGTVGATSQTQATITAIADDPQATVTVMGQSLQGGGRFMPSLAIGLNTVIVNVESADLSASQTYSIDIQRVRKSEENVRQSTIAGGAGGWTFQIPIVRTRMADGGVLDTVELDAGQARDILAKSEQSKDSVAYIYVTDIPAEPADERLVGLSAESLALLAGGGISLQIVLPEAAVDLPAVSLQRLGKEGKKVYFRVVPIVAGDELGEVKSRVLAAELVRQAAGDGKVSVIGHPVKIETNSSGFKAGLMFPLKDLRLPEDEAAARRMLSELAIYIEHGDGDKVLAPGEIRYDDKGNATGIAIEIEKFSTFTVIRKNATDTVLEPYLSGYPDGTFRPSQSIKRAEFASILHRLGLGGSAEGALPAQTNGFADVSAGHWAADAIAYVQRSGLMLGDDRGLFRPEDVVTRAEIASIISRLLPSSAANQPSVVPFSDTQGHWAADAIRKASQAGLLSGYPDGTFRPERKLTRAETVQVLNKLLERPTAGVSSSIWPDVPPSHWAIREIESASGTVTVSPDGSVRVEH